MNLTKENIIAWLNQCASQGITPFDEQGNPTPNRLQLLNIANILSDPRVTLSNHFDASKDKTTLGIGQTNIYTNIYKVVNGDTLSEIAERFYGDHTLWTVIQRANNLSDSAIFTDQTLHLPLHIIDSTGETIKLRTPTRRAQIVAEPNTNGYLEYRIQCGESIHGLGEVYYGTAMAAEHIRLLSGLDTDTPKNGTAILLPHSVLAEGVLYTRRSNLPTSYVAALDYLRNARPTDRIDVAVKGDSYHEIAKKHYGAKTRLGPVLAAVNGNLDLVVGMRLFVPGEIIYANKHYRILDE